MVGPPPRVLDYVLLGVLAVVWGGSFMLIKLAIDTVPPVTMTLGRVGIGAAIFAVLIAATGRKLPVGAAKWLAIAGAALFGLALPFSLISWGEARIDSGLAAILMAGMPLMTVALAHFFVAGEGLTIGKLAGVVLGMTGLVVLIGPEQLTTLGDDALRQLAVVAASACYAVNAILMKRLSGEDPYVLSAGIMIAGAAMLLPFSLVLDEPLALRPTPLAWFAIVLLGVFSTAAASLIMLALLRRQGASFFSQINFLVPLCGVLWGVLLLSETLPPQAFVALGLILAGVAISRGAIRRAPRRATRSTAEN